MKGQGLIEWVLILVLVAVVVICILTLVFDAFNRPSCSKSDPTAGDIVNWAIRKIGLN